MKKRVLALFLALVLCLGLIPMTALAAEEEVIWTVTELVPIGKYDADFADFNFSDGLAMVYRDGKYGYIDKTGVEIIPCKYVSADSFSEGLAPVCLGDLETKKWGMIDKTGTEVVFCKNNYNLVESFHHGLALVWDENLCKGFIDKTGTEVVPCKYRGWGGDSYSWSEGFMVVEDKNWNRGFVDTTGKEIVPCKYEVARSFSEGLAAVELHGKWGYIDTTGAEVVPCKYSSVANYSEGLAAVADENWNWGFIDKTGVEVIPCKYDWPGGFFSEDLAAVELDGKCGYIDKMGRVVVPFKYDWAGPFSEGLAAVELHGKWGHIDTTGAEVVPCKYDWAENFSEGLALVCLGDGEVGKYGYIDKAGQEIVPCNYDEAYDFSFGLGAVWQDGKLGFVDTAGNEVIPCTLECDICSFIEEGLVSIGREANEYARGGGIDYEYGLFSITRTIAQVNSGSMESGEGKSLDWTCSETGRVTVSGELAEDETVLAACYDDQGRFTEVKQLTRDALTAQLKAGADKIKLFWLDGSQSPLSGCATVWGE